MNLDYQTFEKPRYRKPDVNREIRRNGSWGEELLDLLGKSRAFSAIDIPSYTVDDRVIEEAEKWHNHWRVDARDMEWDGYEWIEI